MPMAWGAALSQWGDAGGGVGRGHIPHCLWPPSRHSTRRWHSCAACIQVGVPSIFYIAAVVPLPWVTGAAYQVCNKVALLSGRTLPPVRTDALYCPATATFHYEPCKSSNNENELLVFVCARSINIIGFQHRCSTEKFVYVDVQILYFCTANIGSVARLTKL